MDILSIDVNKEMYTLKVEHKSTFTIEITQACFEHLQRWHNKVRTETKHIFNFPHWRIR